jgi:tRNA(adenine34) deaminase
LASNLHARHVELSFPSSASEEAATVAEKKSWVHKVKTVLTFPPEGIFTKDAKTIANVMATKEVSPQGIGSGIRMIQFFINRAGKNLPPERKRELETAKKILQDQASKKKSRLRIPKG